MSQYGDFRTWILSQVVDGATPRQVARWLRTYRDKFADTQARAWSDGEIELPTEAEIDQFRCCPDWKWLSVRTN